MKVGFCVPFLDRPTAPFISALEAAVPVIEAAGFEHFLVHEKGNPYISSARATMARKALNLLKEETDLICFLDYDVSFRPEDMLKLLTTEGDVACGTYRFKDDGAETYMGSWKCDASGVAIKRPTDGALEAVMAPAGFLRLTVRAIGKFMRAYPELVFGHPWNPSIDLFNHGAWEGVWYGEDYSFCRRWRAAGGQVWLIPDLNIDHWGKGSGGELRPFKGNFHEYQLRLPGGSNDPAKAG